MTRYRVALERAAQKQLRAITDKRIRNAIERDIYALADDPRPPGCLKLVGHKDLWRVRMGDWRIVYRIEDGRLVVLVVTVAPRGGVYG
jgi:mRNA interferase RelE/StbE